MPAEQNIINPDEEYEGEQTAESLFEKKENCRILFPAGVTLRNITKDLCMQECAEEENCQSFQFLKNESNGRGQCDMISETQYDVGHFFNCSETANLKWAYYEKKHDYFQIVHRETGSILGTNEQR